jgi:hypothetical protein
MTAGDPWRRREELQDLLADWRTRLVGRQIDRVLAGGDWVSLALNGASRTILQFVCRQAAILFWDAPPPPPREIRGALGPPARSALTGLLVGRPLEACGLLPADRVLVLVLGNGPLYLLLQLFGQRGNLALLDHQGRLRWSLYAAPHPLLTHPPDASTWTGPAIGHPDVAAAFRRQGQTRLAEQLTGEMAAGCERSIRRSLAANDRLVENLARDLAAADRGEERRAAAEALAIHLGEIPRGAREVKLIHPATGQPLRIALDPARSAAANMEHYFRLARKAARGRDVIARRLAEARARGDRQREALHRIADIAGEPAAPDAQDVPDVPDAPDAPDATAGPDTTGPDREQALRRLAALLAWRESHPEWAPAAGREGGARVMAPRPGRGQPRGRGRGPCGGRPALDEIALPFRRYLLPGRWEVWVGRSNQENDELTHHHASPSDYWFHAQGVPGSHVILRTGGKPERVPRQILEAAAGLAALHSKARHSSLVPVVCTLRKYVRKPRRSPPGTAAYQRERSLIVEPGIPEGTENL